MYENRRENGDTMIFNSKKSENLHAVPVRANGVNVGDIQGTSHTSMYT